MSNADLAVAFVCLIIVLGGCVLAYLDVAAHAFNESLLDELWSDEVGADGAFTPPLGLTAATTTAGADTFPREWTIARTSPYDHEQDDAA